MSEIIQKSEHVTPTLQTETETMSGPSLPPIAPFSIAEWSVSANPPAAQRKDPIVLSQVLYTFTLGLA